MKERITKQSSLKNGVDTMLSWGKQNIINYCQYPAPFPGIIIIFTFLRIECLYHSEPPKAPDILIGAFQPIVFLVIKMLENST